MKVLQINVTYRYGSTGRIVSDIHEMLQNNHHESFVIYGRHQTVDEANVYYAGSTASSMIHGLKSRILDRHGFGSVHQTKKIINIIKQINPDIIHLHNIHGYYLNVKLLFDYLKKSKKKVIWTLHDTWAFTGHCAYFEQVGCMKWIDGCHRCPQLREYPISNVLDQSKRNYVDKKTLFTGLSNLKIITPSNYLNSLVKRGFLKDYQTLTINNGIDLEKFKTSHVDYFKDLHASNKKVILGVAGIWEMRKGVNIFIKLASILGPNKQIVLLGDFKNIKVDLSQNILVIPRTSNVEELASIYASADLFLSPTYEDNFPTTNLEALACGTPVITFDTGGSIESVDELVGKVVSKHDFDGLVNAVHEVLSKDKMDYQRSCVDKANKLYNKVDRYLDYINQYLEIMKE